MRKKRYNHKFNDGDIVTDLEHKEIFTFSDSRDGFRAQNAPDKLRLATEDEKNKLENSGNDYISLHSN